MKNKQTNVGSFATVKPQAKRHSLLAIALVAIIGFSFAACPAEDDNGGGGSGGTGGGGSGANSSLNGTWVSASGKSEMTINNGNFEDKIDGYLAEKGTITTNGNNFTMTYTHVHGDYFKSLGGNFSGLQSKWYNKAEWKASPVGKSYTDAQLDQIFGIVATGTYSISGNTLTMSGTNNGKAYTNTFTRK